VRHIDEVHIQYFGSVRAAANGAEEQVSLAGGAGVLLLLRQLSDAHGEALRGELFIGEALRDDLTVSVNGAIIQHAAADELILRPGDTVALLPVFPGGG